MAKEQECLRNFCLLLLGADLCNTLTGYVPHLVEITFEWKAMSVATVCHIRFVTSGFVVSRDISPGYRTWDVLEGSEFLFLPCGPYYQNSSSKCLTRFFGIVRFIVPPWVR